MNISKEKLRKYLETELKCCTKSWVQFRYKTDKARVDFLVEVITKLDAGEFDSD
jgi:hypothetical protein